MVLSDKLTKKTRFSMPVRKESRPQHVILWASGRVITEMLQCIYMCNEVYASIFLFPMKRVCDLDVHKGLCGVMCKTIGICSFILSLSRLLRLVHT